MNGIGWLKYNKKLILDYYKSLFILKFYKTSIRGIIKDFPIYLFIFYRLYIFTF